MRGHLLARGKAEALTEVGKTQTAGQIPRSAGRYVLILDLVRDVKVRVRSGRGFELSVGAYTYVGSAKGPGGLAARVGRHLAGSQRRHWHIDYLLEEAGVVGVLCFTSEIDECRLASLMAAVPGAEAVEGFGCSDCRCRSHLIRLPGALAADELVELLVGMDTEVRRSLLRRFDLDATQSRPSTETDGRL